MRLFFSFFFFFYVFVSVSFGAACDFDGHLIAASISLRVGHSHWSLKELFLWLSQKPHSSSNETSGVLLSSDMKEDGRCHSLTCLWDHQVCSWRQPINVHIYIYIFIYLSTSSTSLFHQTAISRFFLFGKCYHPLITCSNTDTQMKSVCIPKKITTELCEQQNFFSTRCVAILQTGEKKKSLMFTRSVSYSRVMAAWRGGGYLNFKMSDCMKLYHKWLPFTQARGQLGKARAHTAVCWTQCYLTSNSLLVLHGLAWKRLLFTVYISVIGIK